MPPTTRAGAAATVVRRVPTTRAVVALTFDAGSDAGRTTDILATLAAQHVTATFFVTGDFAQQHPDLIRAIAAGGHRVGNHTQDHRSFTGVSTKTAPLSPEAIADELTSADAVIRHLTGDTTQPLFRPPYGDRNAAVDTAAGAAGYRYDVLWTVDSLGWKGADPAAVVERSVAAAAPGAIVLMHVGAASTDAAALPAVIDGLRALGYGFITLGALG